MDDSFDYNAAANIRKEYQISPVYCLTKTGGKIVPAAKGAWPLRDAHTEILDLSDK